MSLNSRRLDKDKRGYASGIESSRLFGHAWKMRTFEVLAYGVRFPKTGGVVMGRKCKLVFSVQENGVLIDCHPGGLSPRPIEQFTCTSLGELKDFLSSSPLGLDNGERERIVGSCEKRNPCAVILRENLCQADTIDAGRMEDHSQCPLWNQLTRISGTALA